MSLMQPLVWVKNTQTKVNNFHEDIKSYPLNWHDIQINDEILFLKEVYRRRIANILGEETIKYEPNSSELDDLSIEELLEYEA